jgi:hypothetical protein
MIIPLSIFYHQLLCDAKTPARDIGTAFGIVAGFAYVIGIMRWVLLARMLSAKLVDPATTAQGKEMIVLVFQAFDVYCGNAFGETIAPLAHGFWVVLLGLSMRQTGIFPRWIAWAQISFGAIIATRPLEYIGLKPVAEISDVGTMLWTLLLLGMGIALVRAHPATNLRQAPERSTK